MESNCLFCKHLTGTPTHRRKTSIMKRASVHVTGTSLDVSSVDSAAKQRNGAHEITRSNEIDGLGAGPMLGAA